VTKLGYETSVQTRMAVRFIRDHADEPFFLERNYLAPHDSLGRASPEIGSPVPHESHQHDFDGYQVPRTAAYNEADVSDKPAALRAPRMTRAQTDAVDRLAENRRETLQSVDDGLRAIRTELRRTGALLRTNVMFVSDNGYMLGEHRWPNGKVHAYEPSARVPLLVTGPGVHAQGAIRPTPVGLHDIASTVTKWFGLGRMPAADGLPVVGHPHPGRDIVLQGSREESLAQSYTGLRTGDGYTYVEYLEGDGVELYDLHADPLEISNLAGRPYYAELQDELHRRLVELRTCAGATCQ
jgi:N-acetylglucosamine-6-sulfatase